MVTQGGKEDRGQPISGMFLFFGACRWLPRAWLVCLVTKGQAHKLAFFTPANISLANYAILWRVIYLIGSL